MAVLESKLGYLVLLCFPLSLVISRMGFLLSCIIT